MRRRPEVVNDFMYFINRPFAKPEDWKCSNLNMERVKLATEEGKFIVGQDEVKQLVKPE